MLISDFLKKTNSGVHSIKEHIKSHGKTYLVGIAVVAALGLTAYIQLNMQDEYTVRVSGGRTISSDELADSTIRTIDPSPVLRQLSKLISR